MKMTAAAVLAASVFASGSAFAQTADPPPADPVLRPLGGLAPSATGPVPEGRGPRMLGMREGRDAPPPPSLGGAEFSFQNGPMAVQIRCGEGEGVKACADAALALMDKFAVVSSQALKPSSASGEAAAPAQPVPAGRF